MNKKNIRPRWWHLVVVIGIVITVVGIRLYQNILPTGEVKINGTSYKVMIADTNSRRYFGLSNRESLGNFSGMLFVYESPGYLPMVMRNMKFPLDIIWFDKERIVNMESNIAPENVLEQELIPHFSRKPAYYVLEMPMGSISHYGFMVGDKVEIMR